MIPRWIRKRLARVLLVTILTSVGLTSSLVGTSAAHNSDSFFSTAGFSYESCNAFGYHTGGGGARLAVTANTSDCNPVGGLYYYVTVRARYYSNGDWYEPEVSGILPTDAEYGVNSPSYFYSTRHWVCRLFVGCSAQYTAS